MPPDWNGYKVVLRRLLLLNNNNLRMNSWEILTHLEKQERTEFVDAFLTPAFHLSKSHGCEAMVVAEIAAAIAS